MFFLLPPGCGMAGGNFASRLNFTGDGHNDTIKGQAEVAQLVEQLIRNQQVVGSSPTFGSILQQHKRDRLFARMASPVGEAILFGG